MFLREPIDRAGVVVLPFFLGFCVLLLIPKVQETGFAGWVILSPGLVFFAYLLWRFTRLGIGLGPGGILIRNPVRDYQLAWDEIESFGETNPNGTVWTLSPSVKLRDGKLISLNAVQSPNPVTRPKNHFGDEATAFLNALLAESRLSSETAIGIEAIKELGLKHKMPLREGKYWGIGEKLEPRS
jgi:hypothetical protein